MHDSDFVTDNSDASPTTPEIYRRRGSMVGPSVLQSYLDHKPSLSTARRWVRKLGFSYHAQKKSYYVDGPEKPEQKFHRYKLFEKYLVKDEIRMHRWIQYSNEEIDKLKF